MVIFRRVSECIGEVDVESGNGAVIRLGMSDVHHATAYYTGRVQGVGFRYQTLQVAKGYEVAGYVINLPDGRVLVEAEGSAVEVKGFLKGIEERLEGYIRKVEVAEGRRSPQYQGFTIR